MANSFLKCDPHPSYYDGRVKPYTIEELDSHADRRRLWATIMQIRMECQEACNRARELGYQEGCKDYEDGY